MLAFSQWIAASRLSAFVQDVLWLIPTLQTFHILALALLFSAVGAVTLRSFGRLARNAPAAELARRFSPWVWGALVVLLVTGTILIIGEPVRELINWAFWIKIPLLLAAAIATAVLFGKIAHQPATAGPAGDAATRPLAAGLVLVWALVIVFGRLIAYAQIANT